MTCVAGNMERHAGWVANSSAAGRAEHDALMRVAGAYRAMAAAAGEAAAAMTAMKELAPAPHDRAKLDRAGQLRFLREKIAIQRELAAMLVAHAAESQAAIAELGG
jgi:hypothetical protein